MTVVLIVCGAIALLMLAAAGVVCTVLYLFLETLR